jgi:hypothetical protein
MGDTMTISASDSNEIYNNIFWMPTDIYSFPALRLGDGTDTGQIIHSPADSNVIRNNIFGGYYSSSYPSRVLVLCKGEGTTEPGCGTSNVFSNNQFYWRGSDTDTTDIFQWIETGDSYTTYTWDEFSSYKSGARLTDSYYSNPGFVNESGRDFRIKPGSDGEDNGYDVDLMLDMANNSVSSTPEIGAYEIQPTMVGGAINN